MNDIIYMNAIISIVIGYAAGNFLTAELVARKYTGKSAYEIGTGNPGMANIMAQAGKKAGLLVLAGDLGKTFLALLICRFLLGNETKQVWELWCGLGTVLGHNFPVWKKFHGGKGVAVTCAWIAYLMPIWGIASCALGGIITLITGYLPLGAVLIPIFAATAAFLFESPAMGNFMLAALLIMITRHYRGMMRIFAGKEPRMWHKNK